MYEDLAIIQIADNGPGIPREDQRRRFLEGLYAWVKNWSVEKPGTGFGLYIVRTLVKKLGGKVRVVDRLKKTGTVFEVQLTGRKTVNRETPDSIGRGRQRPRRRGLE